MEGGSGKTIAFVITYSSVYYHLVSLFTEVTPLFWKIPSLYCLVAFHTVYQAFLRDTSSSQVPHDRSLNIFMSP